MIGIKTKTVAKVKKKMNDKVTQENNTKSGECFFNSFCVTFEG